MQDTSMATVKGLYHNQDKVELMVLVYHAPLTESPVWKVRRAGSKIPGAEIDNSWVEFADVFAAKEYIESEGFYALNENIVLVPTDKYEECELDQDFWDSVSRVFGPDTLSVVLYKRSEDYSMLALDDLHYEFQDNLWIWYGTWTSASIECWLNRQILEETAIRARNGDEDANNVRVTRITYQIDKCSYRTRKLIYQWENGERIEF